MAKRLKIRGTWCRVEARSCGGGVESQVGWVRARTEDGSCWLLMHEGSEFVTVPSLREFAERIRAHGSIDPDLWRRETGPEPDETDPYLEYMDANDRY